VKRAGSRPLVATSVNPTSDLAHQHACAEAWVAAGFELLSFNAAHEADALVEAGFGPDRIERLGPNEDAGEIFGKPVPRILSVLRRVTEASPRRSVIVVNADVYPALRSARVVEFWSRLAPAMAMTRMECVSITPGALRRADPYRGGLDAFHFAPGALEPAVERLAGYAVAERMAFGIPGWDYLLGGVIQSDAIGGRIMDSAVLCHLVHAQSYSALDELEHYRSAFAELGVAAGKSLPEMAEQFTALIRSSCNRWAADARLASAMFCSWPSLPDFDEQTLRHASDTIDDMRRRWPRIADGIELADVAAALRRLQRGGAIMSAAGGALVNSPSQLARFGQVLHAIAMALGLRPDASSPAFAQDYPPGNQHAAALNNIISRHPEEDPGRRLHIAWLFGTELLDYRIFNRRLFDFLALSCRNDDERSLLNDIARKSGVRDD